MSPSDSVYRELQNVEVVGRKGSDDLTSTIPAHKIREETVLTTGITDISDAMKRIPGVNLRDYGGSGGLKTVSVRGLGAQHTGVVYDGVALSDVQSGQIDLSRYSLDNVKSLWLNIGDNDDIYAPARSMASATSLLINSQREPNMMDTKLELVGQFKFGSFGFINPYLRLGKSNGENFSWNVIADFIHAKNNYPYRLRNGLQTTTERRENSQLNSGHAEVNASWKPNSGSTLSVKGYFYDNGRQLPGPVIYYAPVSHEKLRERNIFGQLAYKTKLSSKFSLMATAKFNWASSRYKDIDGKYPGGMLDQYYIQKEEYVQATALYIPLKGLRMSYAIDYFHNSLNSNLKTNNRPFRNSLLQALSVKYSFWRMTVTARGLLSVYHDKSSSSPTRKTATKLSPSVGFSIQPVENVNWHIRGSYKNIFRLPTFNELYFDHYGSINLNPEITDLYNLGTVLNLSPSSWFSEFEISVDGYINSVKNKIVAVPYNMFVMTMINLGSVHGRGFDAALSAKFDINESHGILLNGNYSYQRAEIHTDPLMTDYGKQVAYTPLNSGAWSVTWLNPWVNLVAHGTGASSKYATNSNVASTRIGGYMELGFTAYRNFKIKRHDLEVRADLINALNKRYELVARYPMPGISWNVSIKFTL